MAALTSITQADVEKLCVTDTYNSSIIPSLEAYLNQSVASASPYSFQATKTLLKFYSFFPTVLNPPNSLKAMLLSLADFPTGNFGVLTFIVQPNESTQLQTYTERLNTIMRWGELIETGDFVTFWAEFGEEQLSDKSRGVDDLPLTTLFPGFASALRSSILQTLSLTFKKMPVAQFNKFLNVSGVDSAPKSDVVDGVEGDCVAFRPVAGVNDVRSKVENVGASFNLVSKVL